MKEVLSFLPPHDRTGSPVYRAGRFRRDPLATPRFAQKHMHPMRVWSSAKQMVRYLFPPVCRNVNHGNYSKRCLLSYITKPFRDGPSSVIHQNRWQVRELARVIGGYGYNVDVVDWYHARVKLEGKYDLLLDVSPGQNHPHNDHLAEGASRVALLTTSNPATSNQAETARLERIARSRGVKLKPRWYLEPLTNEAVESCAAFWLIGNSQTLSTYRGFALPPVSLIRNTGYSLLYPSDNSRKSPRSFLFLGSRGQVHKGLDLLLEIFAELPQLRLYVCGHFAAEKDFCEAYRKELFETPNIVPVGFVDITGDHFRSLVAECSYVVMPSCAEGMSGSVLTGMSAGLIPVVSRECGFDGADAHLLEDCSLACIRDTVDSLSRQPADWIRNQSLAAVKAVRLKFLPDHYTDCIRTAMQSLVGEFK
jgi:glycosyltransferase involved in cell wall biosynthesis